AQGAQAVAEPRHGLFAEALAPGETPQRLDQLGCARSLADQVMGATRARRTFRASTCVRRQGRISISGTMRGLIRSLMRLANRSS
ncbi:hypothetical protein, partial [Cyanobium sp. Cruz CV11-17]|uniref:hypothetical protein n=1 Tax=Cyanobium sp. Cruz CV11-17 TaxID=2823709 RepID=UPI0020CEAD84